MLSAVSICAGATQQLTIGLVILAAAMGAIRGDNVGYLIGRERGYRLLRHYGRDIRLDERKLKLGQSLFLRHGGQVVFFGRVVAVLRAWAAFLAGVNRMASLRFVVYNATGGILWATLYGIGAFVLGQNIHRFVGPVGLALGISSAAIVILGFLLFPARNERRLEAEQALPGPLDRVRVARHQPVP